MIHASKARQPIAASKLVEIPRADGCGTITVRPDDPRAAQAVKGPAKKAAKKAPANKAAEPAANKADPDAMPEDDDA